MLVDIVLAAALAVSAPSHATSGARARVVEVARHYVGRPYAGDCSAFVQRVYRAARVPLPRRSIRGASGSEMLFRRLATVRQPRPGDLVFFHRTYDRDRPGRGRNLFTHVGVVESANGSRVTFIHRIGGGVTRSTMNVARPRDPEENDVLRRRRASDGPAVRHLTGELFAAYASAMRDAPRAARRPPSGGAHRSR